MGSSGWAEGSVSFFGAVSIVAVITSRGLMRVQNLLPSLLSVHVLKKTSQVQSS